MRPGTRKEQDSRTVVPVGDKTNLWKSAVSKYLDLVVRLLNTGIRVTIMSQPA